MMNRILSHLQALILFFMIGIYTFSSLHVKADEISTPVSLSKKMSLEDYLNQVKTYNVGVKAALLSADAGQMRSKEGDLLLIPNFFADGRVISDAKLPQFSFMTYDKVMTKTVSFGFVQNTSFGLQAKLHYDLIQSNMINVSSTSPAIPGLGNFSFPISSNYTNASPTLELNQSLWNNGFGRTTRALQEQIEAQALSSSYNSRYQAKMTLSQAESSYWNLALSRQMLAMNKEALERANLIYQWNLKRARLHLGDQSDVLQSEALMKTRELDVMSAQDAVRSASRNFNAIRFIDSDSVKEELEELTPAMMDQIQIPARAQFRDDVKAANELTRAAESGATISIEKNKPTLELSASVGLNGQVGSTPANDIGTAMSNSFSLDRPSASIGVHFQAPLDLELTKKATEGWKLEKISAEKNYQQRMFSQEEDWKNLLENLNEAKLRLNLSRKLEQIQQAKLKTERERLNQGRTTTYQVLLFEQDYLLAQMTRVRNQANILNIIAQMKLFGESL